MNHCKLALFWFLIGTTGVWNNTCLVGQNQNFVQVDDKNQWAQKTQSADTVIMILTDEPQTSPAESRPINPWSELSNHATGPGPSPVIREQKIMQFAFQSTTTRIDSLNNLNRDRTAYFVNRSLPFFDLSIAKSYNPDSIFSVASKELSTYIPDLAERLEFSLDSLPKIKICFYKNSTDLGQLLAMPPTHYPMGLEIDGVIHISSYDLNILKQLVTQIMIRQTAGSNTNSFFREGFRRYADYLSDWSFYSADKDSVNTHVSDLSIAWVNSDLFSFFSNPAGPSMAGVFVKYLIDKIGLAGFKDIYSRNQIDMDIKARYGYSMDQLIREFKNTIKHTI